MIIIRLALLRPNHRSLPSNRPAVASSSLARGHDAEIHSPRVNTNRGRRLTVYGSRSSDRLTRYISPSGNAARRSNGRAA